jgi:F-type H+-transporting ATPase subunit b
MVEQATQAGGLAGIVGPLGVNGKLLFAQFLNVAIIVLVMWRWVYRPLLKMLDERTQKIEKGLSDAQAAAELKRAADEDKDATIAQARMKAKEIVEAAQLAAQKERDLAVVRAKEEVKRVVEEGKEQIKAEKAKMMGEIKSAAGSLLSLALEKVAKEKLDDKKDERLIRDSLKQAMEQL